MMNEFKDFSTVMVFHQLEQSWRQETHIIGKKLVLLVRNLYNQLENFDHSSVKPTLVVKNVMHCGYQSCLNGTRLSEHL